MALSESIRRRLDVMLDALSDLRRYRDRFDARALSTDRDAQHMVLHALYIAAQAAIDIALHGSAAAESPSAGTYQEAFGNLATAGRLNPGLALRMKGWAGLRNILAHQYVRVDLARIAAMLSGELGDLEEFAAAVGRW